jgi:hypothetical protein
MAGTPLNEAVISAIKIVPEFQKKYKLQIVNTVFLTDGEGHSLNQIYEEIKYLSMSDNEMKTKLDSRIVSGKRNRFVIRHPQSKIEEVISGDEAYRRKLTAVYLKILKRITHTNVLGFYVLGGREIRNEVTSIYGPAANIEKMVAEFRKTKALTVTSAGYDEYYMLRSEGLDTDDDVEFEVKENATTRGLVSAFSKYTNNRIANRVVLNRFIGMIA